MKIRSTSVVLLIILMIYPAATLLQRIAVFGTPFDSETTHRFLIPFTFENSANFSWTVSESIQHGFTRPIYSLTFLLDYSLWKTDFRFYHLTDFLLSWATFVILLLLFKKRFGMLVASLTVVLWALHPAQAYSMISFTGRNDRLVVLFVLAVLALYDRAVNASSRPVRMKFLTGSLAFAITGYFAKETCLPYIAIAFGWGWLVLHEKPILTFRKGIILWIGGGVSFTVLMLTKPMFDLGLPAEFGFGSVYFHKFGELIAWILPFNLRPNLFLGVTSIVLLIGLMSLRKAPAAVRFGAFLALVSLAPFPFVWVQKTFIWLPTVGLCLIISGVLVAVFQRFNSHASRISVLVIAFVLLFSMAYWGRNEAYKDAAKPIAFKIAARYLVETQQGPVYDGNAAVNAVPAIRNDMAMNPGEPEITHKCRLHLEQLVKLMVLNSNAGINWF